MMYEVSIDGHSHRLELKREEQGWKCHLNGKEIEIDAVLARPNVLSLIVNGASYEIRRELAGTDLNIWVENEAFKAELRNPRSLRGRRAAGEAGAGPQKIVAPMPGRIVRVMATAGDEVDAGQGLLVIEAMKMQNELKSKRKGIVKQIMVSEGATVSAGDVLALVE
jgi:biotin carboxyl carrier protein